MSIQWEGTASSTYELKICSAKDCATVENKNSIHTIRVLQGVQDYTFQVRPAHTCSEFSDPLKIDLRKNAKKEGDSTEIKLESTIEGCAVKFTW